MFVLKHAKHLNCCNVENTKRKNEARNHAHVIQSIFLCLLTASSIQSIDDKNLIFHVSIISRHRSVCSSYHLLSFRIARVIEFIFHHPSDLLYKSNKSKVFGQNKVGFRNGFTDTTSNTASTNLLKPTTSDNSKKNQPKIDTK